MIMAMAHLRIAPPMPTHSGSDIRSISGASAELSYAARQLRGGPHRNSRAEAPRAPPKEEHRQREDAPTAENIRKQGRLRV